MGGALKGGSSRGVREGQWLRFGALPNGRANAPMARDKTDPRNGTNKLLPLGVNSWIAFLLLVSDLFLEPFSAASYRNPTRWTRSKTHSLFRRRCPSTRAPKARHILPQLPVPFRAVCPGSRRRIPAEC